MPKRRPRWGEPEGSSNVLYIVECYMTEPPYIDRAGKRRRGRWTTCYSWVYACGSESSAQLSSGSRARTKILTAAMDPRGAGTHRDTLAYASHADAVAAVAQIRKWKSCRYKVRIVRKVVWTEMLVCPEVWPVSGEPVHMGVMQ